jgi:hypothetical protein
MATTYNPPLVPCSHCGYKLPPDQAFWRWHAHGSYCSFPLCLHCARLAMLRFTAAAAIAEARAIIRGSAVAS